MYVFNNTDNVFKEGDVVWTANTICTNEECYDVEVIQVLSDDVCKGLGIHYVLLVRTHIDDYIIVREARCCFRSEEQFNTLRAEVLKFNRKRRS